MGALIAVLVTIVILTWLAAATVRRRTPPLP